MKVKLLATLGAVGALGLAYALDDWVVITRRTASRTFERADMQRLLWGSGLTNLLLASALLLLAALVYGRPGRSRLLAVILIVIGLPAAFFGGLWSTLPIVWPIDPAPVLGPVSHFNMAGAFIAALGLAALVAPRAAAIAAAASSELGTRVE
jgi:uncharacterized membrane protein